MSNNCLVLTPASDMQADSKKDKRINNILKLGIAPVLSEAGFVPRIITTKKLAESELNRFFRQLSESQLNLILIEGIELDLLYLIGICHGLALPSIVLRPETQEFSPLFKSMTQIIYGSEINTETINVFRQDLKHLLSDLQKLSERNPVAELYPFEKRPVSQERYAKLKQELQRRTNQLKNLQDELRETQKALDLKSIILRDPETELEQLNHEILKYRERIQQLQTELKQFQNRV